MEDFDDAIKLIGTPDSSERQPNAISSANKRPQIPFRQPLEELLKPYYVAASLQNSQPLFQSLNLFETAVTRRVLNRYNAWAAIRKRTKAAGFLAPVGCHTSREQFHVSHYRAR